MVRTQERLVKTVMRSGNSGSVYLPREWVSQKVVIRPLTIKENIIEKIMPHTENIIGAYLYGSHSRGEETADSDIDVLLITDKKIDIKKEEEYDIEAIQIDKIKEKIREDPTSYYSIIREAKTIINPHLLKELRKIKPNPQATKKYLKNTKEAIKIAEKLLRIEGDHSGTIYSLMLRIRGLYIIECIRENREYTNKRLREHLLQKGIDQKTYEKSYAVYRAKRDNRQPQHTITTEEAQKLLHTAQKTLKDAEKNQKSS
ncbi:MAG: nucleotidyltransferase domain-containing protein [Candidatus Altiarchaeota archaeon]|nr:nucleotidyltransferase domain-containing protein [Candidatus Altiarchaeota archaeon]